jgi:hypothetical protein
MADGHLGKCKDCANEYSKQHRKEKKEYYQEYEKQRSQLPDRKEKMLTRVRNYRHKHPERASANQKVNRAISSGKLTPQPCFVCGEKAVAHHPDYSRPLDVT